MIVNDAAEKEEKRDRAYSRKEVVEIIGTVMNSIDLKEEPEARLHNELSILAEYINSMRTELVALRTIGISHNDVPTASDELDAVVEETATATGAIMDACEVVEKVAEEISDDNNSNVLNGAVTSIYEACGFQDITGQRITKVVKTLKKIEVKVDEIIHVFEEGKEKPKAKEESLLNGPQLKGGGSSQEEIDALLASFD